jgi:hypothetical protein
LGVEGEDAAESGEDGGGLHFEGGGLGGGIVVGLLQRW